MLRRPPSLLDPQFILLAIIHNLVTCAPHIQITPSHLLNHQDPDKRGEGGPAVLSARDNGAATTLSLLLQDQIVSLIFNLFST